MILNTICTFGLHRGGDFFFFWPRLTIIRFSSRLHYLKLIVLIGIYGAIFLVDNIVCYSSRQGGTRCRSWLRPCATSRKVAGSIPDGVIGHNPFGRTMAPGVDSASNRNEYQEYFLGSRGDRCVGLTILPPTCADYLEIWEPQPS